MADTQTNSSDNRPYGLKPGEPTIQEFLSKTYSNPKYKALPEDQKKEFDNQTYDRFVKPYYERIAKSDPPKKEDWLKTPADMRSKIQDQVTLKQAGNYAVAGVSRIARGGEKVLKNVTDLAFDALAPGDKREREVTEQWKKNIDVSFNNRIELQNQLIHDKDLHQRDADGVKKATDFLLDHTADLALFRGVGGAGHAVEQSLVAVAGKTIATKAAIKAGVAAIDAYVSGYGVTGSKEEAKSWAKWGAGISLGSSLLAKASPALQQYLVTERLKKQMTPQLLEGFQKSAAVQQKAGQKPTLELVGEKVQQAQKEVEVHQDIKNADRIVPGAATGKSPEFVSNLPKADMRLEGDINKYTFALGKYMEKNPNSPYAKHVLNELSSRLPELSEEELKQFPGALQQHMKDLRDTGHTSPEDIRGVFRSTNLNAVFGKGKPTEFQDELADEIKEVKHVAKKKDALQPSRTFNIGRGSDKGQVRVSFPTDDLANLYAYKGRVSKQMSGGIGKDPLREQLVKKYGTDLYGKSAKYREQINKAIKNLEEGEVFIAPEPE